MADSGKTRKAAEIAEVSDGAQYLTGEALEEVAEEQVDEVQMLRVDCPICVLIGCGVASHGEIRWFARRDREISGGRNDRKRG